VTKVLADDLGNDQASSLVKFMTAMSNGRAVQHRKSIEVNGLTNKKVKFLLHKFLHANHLTGYDVLVSGGTFEIVRVKDEPKPMEKPKGLKHPVPYGPPIPYLSGVVKPRLAIEWQSKPPTKRTRYKE